MKYQIIFKAGNSLAVSIPAKFAHQLGVTEGQKVTCETDIKNSRVIYNFPEAKQLNLLATASKGKPE